MPIDDVIPGQTLNPLKHLAERLRASIAEHDFDLGNAPLTVSMGIAEHRIGEDRTSLIEPADNNLYAAKHEGRNRAISSH